MRGRSVIKLSAEIRGDAPPFDVYFNGEKMTAYEPTHKLYATTDAPKTLDEVLPFAAQKAGILLPFEDVLYSDPYAALTKAAVFTSRISAATACITPWCRIHFNPTHLNLRKTT